MSALKVPTSIRIDASILKTLKVEAASENRSLSNYIEVLLYRLGYRPYNAETVQACKDAREGKTVGELDLSNFKTFMATAFDEED